MKRLAAVVASVAVVLLGASAAAQDASEISLDASIDGRSIANATDGSPIELDPSRSVELTVRVRNDDVAPAEIRYVRLEGRVIGLTFFSYTTQVGFAVEAGASDDRTYELDLVGLEGQATGKIPASIQVLDADREVIASERFVADVQGSLRSVYGVFGLLLLALTAVFLVRALLDLARGRLPSNRWARAARFAVPGVGIGLVIVFTLSAFHVVAPSGARWWILIAVCGAVFFFLGYVTPSTDTEDEITAGPLEPETVRIPADETAAAGTAAWAPPAQAADAEAPAPPATEPVPVADETHGEMPPPQSWGETPPPSQGWGEVPPPPPTRPEGGPPPG